LHPVNATNPTATTSDVESLLIARELRQAIDSESTGAAA
jgi:hypothetical protein